MRTITEKTNRELKNIVRALFKGFGYEVVDQPEGTEGIILEFKGNNEITFVEIKSKTQKVETVISTETYRYIRQETKQPNQVVELETFFTKVLGI